MKPMAKKEVVRRLTRNGVVMVRQDGDHEVWKVGACQAYVPKRKTISPGVCRDIQQRLVPELGKGWLQ